jgi:hypothetical protein
MAALRYVWHGVRVERFGEVHHPVWVMHGLEFD